MTVAQPHAGWVGRSIRRVEDPTLIAGSGRFTADLPATYRVRFVRSDRAAGRISKIHVPASAIAITAADLAGVKPIRPMLHKFDYVPVSQPVLAVDQVRFVGEPIVAVVASSDAEAEDIADAIEVEIEAQAAAIQSLKDRLTALEQHVKAREDILVAEAKGAAAATASVIASQHVADIARRLGGMEERLNVAASRKSLPSD